MSGKAADAGTVRRDARMFLEISYADAGWLFTGNRTMFDFENFLLGDGYNRAGYNRAGLDRDGYDLDGLDRNFKLRPEAV
jgi:hypothetical protein